MVKNTDLSLDNALKTLGAKQIKVLKERYGLTGKKKTLQEIGDSLGITRERVRQIENQGLKKIKPPIIAEFSDLIDTAKKYLDSSGGVEEDDKFIGEVARLAGITETGKSLKDKVRFVLFAADAPLLHDENNHLKSFWYSSESAKAELVGFVDKNIKLFENTDKNKVFGVNGLSAKIKTSPEYRLLFISKKFSVNPFGDIGLVDWAEIKPKNVRDKAYLILKKENAPLHFRDIAKKIAKSNIGNKTVNTQTVHNELIKDNRFVLVGRGIYALEENGYEAGTVKDVIASLIKNKGPLNSESIINLVNEKRLLKENTILLNLQNRKHFKRMSDGRYSLHEA